MKKNPWKYCINTWKNPALNLKYLDAFMWVYYVFRNFQPRGPTMSSVVFLLANEGARLPWPEQPGFFMERCSTDLDARTRGEQSHTQNEISPTVERR